MAEKKPIFGSLADTLENYFAQMARIKNENKVYDENRKTFDISKVMTNEELENVLSTRIGSTNYDSSTLFEKFFNLSLDRDGRYRDYEQIVYRIPEAAQALQIYVDSILAPDAGDSDRNFIINIIRETDTAEQAKAVLDRLLEDSDFAHMLPQIVYTSLLYGDAFLEIDPTSTGIRYILHNPSKCSIIYDVKTDIEVGLLVQQEDTNSEIRDMLCQIYPELQLDIPEKLISIVSNKQILGSNRSKTHLLEEQMTELLKDIYRDSGTKCKYIAPHRYVRFPIYYNSNYYPYGTSILDSVRSVSKQLLLTEAALAIYRATRTPLRNMWTIEVGNMPGDQVPVVVRGIMDKVRRNKIIDNETNDTFSIDSIPEIMGEQDDIWVTSKEGVKQLTYENLPSPDIQPYTNDADYFRKKILSGLGIPPSYLAEESGGSTRALLTLEDVKFSRTIKKYQSDFNKSLRTLVDLCFNLLNKPEFINTVKLTLPPLISIEANMKCENISKRLDTARTLMELYPNIPKYYVLKNVVKFTDEEIDEMIDAYEKQKEMIIFADQVFENGDDGEGEDRGHGFSGGGGGASFDFGSEDDFNEEPMDLGEENGEEISEPAPMEETGGTEAIDNETETLEF